LALLSPLAALGQRIEAVDEHLAQRPRLLPGLSERDGVKRSQSNFMALTFQVFLLVASNLVFEVHDRLMWPPLPRVT